MAVERDISHLANV